ncbi:MAG: efflux RND transporter periplasmic adaptor subunit [Phycisphaerae bacterium]|nr:efflux RND transporter periplasmic adaptor subunit [Phycisphaerae bacterium]
MNQPSRRGFLSLKVIAILTVVGLVIIGGVIAWRSSGRSEVGRPDIHVVAREDFAVTVVSNGELRAKKQTAIRNELEHEAAIVKIVEEGTLVKKGDLLVKLNDDEIRSELDEEMLQRESARAEAITAESDLKIQLTENDASLKKATTELMLAEVDLQKFEAGDAVEKRLELALALEKGHREVRRLTDKVSRSRELFKKDFLSKDELEKDEIELIEAEADLKKAEVAQTAYEDYTYKKERQKLESELEQARADLDKTTRKNESDLASKQASLINKKRQLELREAKVTELESQLARTTILAPTGGLVVYATSLEQYSWMNNEQPLNVGTKINPNQEIIMLPDTSEMIAAVKVHESLVGRIKPGQKAIITIDAAQGRKFNGTVESIGIMARSGGWRDPSVREYEVRILLDLPESEHGLKPSMRCESRITLMNVEDAIAVPLPGVFTEAANQFVYVVDGDRYTQTQVRIGRRSDTTAEIVSGLKEGQRIALREPPSARIIKTKFEPAPGAGAPDAGRRRGGGAMNEKRVEPDAPAAKPPVTTPPEADKADRSDPAAEDEVEAEDEPTDEKPAESDTPAEKPTSTRGDSSLRD